MPAQPRCSSRQPAGGIGLKGAGRATGCRSPRMRQAPRPSVAWWVSPPWWRHGMSRPSLASFCPSYFSSSSCSCPARRDITSCFVQRTYAMRSVSSATRRRRVNNSAAPSTDEPHPRHIHVRLPRRAPYLRLLVPRGGSGVHGGRALLLFEPRLPRLLSLEHFVLHAHDTRQLQRHEAFVFVS